MSFNKISLKSTYNSEEDSIINDFYIPNLGEAVAYDRAVGFFLHQCLPMPLKLNLKKVTFGRHKTFTLVIHSYCRAGILHMIGSIRCKEERTEALKLMRRGG